MRRFRGLTGICTILLLLACVSSALAQAPISLKYKFVPNQVLNYATTMRGTASIAAQGAPMMVGDTNIKGSLDLRQRILGIRPDGAATVQLSCPRMAFNITLPGQTMALLWQNQKFTVTLNGQSTSAPSKELAALPLFGKPLRMVMSPYGKVLDMPDLTQLQGMMGNVDFSQMMKLGQNQLPDRPVMVGETWSTSTNVPVPGSSQSLITNATYTLAGIETVGSQQAARINFITSSSGSGISITAPNTNQSVSIDQLTENSQGSMLFGLQSGKLLRSYITSRIHQQMSGPTAPAGSGASGPTQISIDMNFTANTSLK